MLRRIKHNLKTGIIQARKDTDILTNLESEHNDKLFAADSNPEEALLYDELLQAGDALKRKMHQKNVDAMRKSKINWPNEGNSNSSFFAKCR